MSARAIAITSEDFITRDCNRATIWLQLLAAVFLSLLPRLQPRAAVFLSLLRMSLATLMLAAAGGQERLRWIVGVRSQQMLDVAAMSFLSEGRIARLSILTSGPAMLTTASAVTNTMHLVLQSP